MLTRIIRHLRRQPVALVALFFALSAGAMAANTYIRSTDTISSGDLAGSTYGDPLIANGAVTNAKLHNPSLTITPGTGLTAGGSVALGSSTTLNADETVLQHRLDGGCNSGNAIRSVAQDGTSTCQAIGFTKVTRRSASNAADEATANVQCNSGETLAGGGGFTLSGTLLASNPNANADGWHVGASATGPAGDVQAFALCAS